MPDVTLASLDAHSRLLLDKAQLALARGQIDYAVEVCGTVLRAHPDAVDVWKLWIRSVRACPSGRSPIGLRWVNWLRRRWLALQSGRSPEATVTRWRLIVQREPACADAWRGLAGALEETGIAEPAILMWEQVCVLAPGEGRSWLALAQAQLDARRWANAITAAERALSLCPRERRADEVLRKASVAETMERGHWEREGSFHEKLRPNASPPSSSLAPGAVEEGTRSVPRPPLRAPRTAEGPGRGEEQLHDADALLELGRVRLAQGEAGQAVVLFQRARRTPRCWTAASIGLGEALFHQGLFDLAICQLRETREALRPEERAWVETTYLLGLSLAALGELEKAQVEFRDVYRIDAGYRDVAARILNVVTPVSAPVPPPTATTPSTKG